MTIAIAATIIAAEPFSISLSAKPATPIATPSPTIIAPIMAIVSHDAPSSAFFIAHIPIAKTINEPAAHIMACAPFLICLSASPASANTRATPATIASDLTVLITSSVFMSPRIIFMIHIASDNATIATAHNINAIAPFLTSPTFLAIKPNTSATPPTINITLATSSKPIEFNIR